jgi:hypothetical protein
MAKVRKSASKKAARLAYKAEDRATKNRKRKLERHLKVHPNDEQGEDALANTKGHVRTKPRGGHCVVKETGIQVVGERKVRRNGKDEVYPIYAYVADRDFMPGHPVHALLKQKSRTRLGDVVDFPALK